MDELIRRGDVVNAVKGRFSWPVDNLIVKIVRDLPAVDAVEVVRKPIRGYEGFYEVDCFGRVYSLERVITVNDNGRLYNKPVSGKIMRQTVKSNGYKSVSLTKDGKSKSFYVHRLVADAFIPNPDGLPMVNHKDEDKTNNFVDNLEWCTNDYNVNYGTSIKRRAQKIRGRVSPNAIVIAAFGETHTRKEWGNLYGIDPHNIERRMRLGWSAERAIITPLMKNQYAYRVVRCSECEHWNSEGYKELGFGRCRYHKVYFEKEDYCSKGERRKDGEHNA